MVHTGAKIQLGGVNDGFFRFAYHSSGLVTNPISSPPPTTSKRNSKSVAKLFILSISKGVRCSKHGNKKGASTGQRYNAVWLYIRAKELIGANFHPNFQPELTPKQ